MVPAKPPQTRRGHFGRWTLPLLLAVGILGWWISRCAISAKVILDEHTACRVRFYQWCSGNCVLRFYRDNAPLGTTVLYRGIFEHPWAVFPGPGGRSLVCFSWLDTTYATFAVDLEHPLGRVPHALEEAVSSSDFQVRACTPAEVAFVTDLIKNTDPSGWASHLGAGELTANEARQRGLGFLHVSTTPYRWKNLAQHDARPTILPSEQP